MPLTNDEKRDLEKRFLNILSDLLCTQSSTDEPVYDESGLKVIKVSKMVDNYHILSFQFYEMHRHLIRLTSKCAERYGEKVAKERLIDEIIP